MSSEIINIEQSSAKKHKAKNPSKRKKSKFRLDIKPENLPIVAPYLWVKRKKEARISPVIKVALKPEKLLKDVYMFISELIHIPSLLNDTAAIMKTFTKSNGVLIYLVDSITNQIYVCPNLTDKTDDANRVAWRIRSGSTIPAYVALTKETVLVNNMTTGEKFQAYDWKDMTVTGVLCVPIVISDGSCFGVIELYRRNGVQYSNCDMKKVIPISRLIAAVVDTNIRRLHLQTKQILINYLLELTQFYFTHPDQLHNLVRDIVHLAKDSLNSERGSFFVHDSKNHELLADVYGQYNDLYGNLLHRHKLKIQANKERGIAGLALQTSTLINIRDAYNDSRFDRKSDIKTGLITRCVLCIPVFGHNGILGVLQLVNKRHGFYEPVDEQMCQMFANYCSMAIEYTNLHEKWIISQKWADIYNECYFTQILNIQIKQDNDNEFDPITLPSDFYEYSFYPTTEDNLLKLSCWIFRSLQIPDENYANFIFSVRRGYHNNHYHNFVHAFTALHSVSITLERHSDKFNYLEKIGLLISAVCHDIDHRGVTNSFLEILESPLVVLYDESPMENHHVFMTMVILEQSSLKPKFSKAEFKILSEYIKEMILATDLTQHLQERNNIRLLCDEIQKADESIWSENLDNRRRVRNLIMTAADLSGMAKPFEKNKIIVKHIMEEFYEEGENMKALGLSPLPIMDIKYIDKVPEFQIQFLEVITIPCFELLQIILPQTYDLLENSQNLRSIWKELIKVRDTLK